MLTEYCCPTYRFPASYVFSDYGSIGVSMFFVSQVSLFLNKGRTDTASDAPELPVVAVSFHN
jgi:hypothetical protein